MWSQRLLSNVTSNSDLPIAMLQLTQKDCNTRHMTFSQCNTVEGIASFITPGQYQLFVAVHCRPNLLSLLNNSLVEWIEKCSNKVGKCSRTVDRVHKHTTVFKHPHLLHYMFGVPSLGN